MVAQRFAMLEAKLALAKILHRFSVAPAPGAPHVRRRAYSASAV
jgi:cytochrome P450